MSNNTNDFQSLLTLLANEQTFPLQLTNGNQVTCKQLTTSQLKELIETVVDSPVTQAIFNTTIAKVFKASLVDQTDISSLSIIDRLLFTLETRINSISSTKIVENEGKKIEVNLSHIKDNLIKGLQENPSLFAESSSTVDNVSLTYGIPLLKAEQQLNEEMYKKLEIDVQNPEQLRKIIGEAFINEIAKTLRTVTINETTFDLSANTFKNRLKVVEMLPAKAVRDVLDYIEQYKQIVDKCFVVEEGVTLAVDGSLFSTR